MKQITSKTLTTLAWNLIGCLVFLFGTVPQLYAKDAVIEELIVTNSSTHVLLFLEVKNAFTQKMEEGIKNGIPVTFKFSIEMSRNRKAWLDQEVIAQEYEHTLTFDTLKEEYTIIFSEQEGQPARTKSLAQAKQLMSRLNGLPVSPLSALIPDEEYTLKVKANLAEKTLPLYFHYVIPFWGLWDFETDWFSVEFRY